MGLLQTLMTDGAGPQGTDVPRWKQFFQQAGSNPRKLLRLLNPRKWSERTMIALVMQHLDNSITTYTRRTRFGFRRLDSKQGHGEPNPTWIPVGNEVTRRIAEKIDGVAGGTWGELFNIPLTAHYLGGAAIGDTAEHGVIDPYQRVYNYPTLSVHDGASISANLGVNPSLSITAQAERAASLWPNKGEVDQRPAQGEPYKRLAPISPNHPVVPVDAPVGTAAPTESSRSARRDKPLANTFEMPGSGYLVPMRTAYHEQLSGLGARLAEMCGLAAKALDDATRASPRGRPRAGRTGHRRARTRRGHGSPG